MPSFMTDGRDHLHGREARAGLPPARRDAGRTSTAATITRSSPQRGTASGTQSATEIIELLDRNLAFVGAPLTSRARNGAGRIVIGQPLDRARPGPMPRSGRRQLLHRRRSVFPTGPITGVFRFVPARAYPTGQRMHRRAAIRAASAIRLDRRTRTTSISASSTPTPMALRDLVGTAGRAEIEGGARSSRAPNARSSTSRIDEANGNTSSSSPARPTRDDRDRRRSPAPRDAPLLENTRNGRPLNERHPAASTSSPSTRRRP